jgi:DNA polymerase I-like protein with 3'-5' exonuclease and polymerase domains
MALRVIQLPKRRTVLNGRGNLAGTCKLPWQGNPAAPVMIVVDPIVYEGEFFDVNPKPMHNRLLTQLAPFMKEAGLSGDNVCFVSACNPIDKDAWTSDSKLGKAIKNDHPKFMEAFHALKPRLVIAQGKAAIRQVLNRPAKITKLRGVAIEDETLGVPIMPMLGLGHVLRVPEHAELFTADMRTAMQIIKNDFKVGGPTGPAKNYKWCTDLQFLINRKPKVLAVDTETSAFGTAEFSHWYNPHSKILTVQLTDKAGDSYVVPIDYPGYPIAPGTRTKLIAQLKTLLENKDCEVVGQNLKYDFLFLLTKIGVKIANYADDVLMLVHMINENMLSKALDDIARVYLPEMAGYKDEFRRKGYDMARMDLVPPEDILAYSAADSDCTFQLRTILKAKIAADPKLLNCYNRVVLPALRAFCDIEPRGFKVNRIALETLRVKVQKKQDFERKRLMSLIPKTIRDKFENTGVGLKLTREVLLRDFLFDHKDGLKIKPLHKTKSGLASTSTKTHLPYFIGKHMRGTYKDWNGVEKTCDLIADLIAYVKNEKMLTTYIGRDRHQDSEGKWVDATGFWQYINGGYIRPSYKLHATVTGRSASDNPNGQNFPKRGEFAKEYRAIFEAPDGWVLLEADYSQLELRIAGILSKEPTFLKIYKEGGDIHCMTAAIVMGISLEAFMALKQNDPEKYALGRYRAKAVNFGFIYGMGFRKFVIYAKTDYGIDYTEEEGKRIRGAFFSKYRALSSWHESVKAFVRIHKYVRCIDGRVRHLPAVVVDDDGVASSAERMAVNSPVQGFGSDLGLIALARINAGLDHNYVRVIGFVHDAIICIARKGREMEAAREVKRYMETNPLKEWFGFTPPIPIIADVSIGMNLAKMIELDKKILGDAKITTFEHVKAIEDAKKKPVQEPAKSRPPFRVIRLPARKAA